MRIFVIVNTRKNGWQVEYVYVINPRTALIDIIAPFHKLISRCVYIADNIASFVVKY